MVSRSLSLTQVADGTQLFGTPGKEGLKIGEFVDASGGIDLALLDQSWQRQVDWERARARSLCIPERERERERERKLLCTLLDEWWQRQVTAALS
jgi:hypothetical protein